MGVVAVDAPGLEHLGGEAELPGAADVVDDLVLAILDERGADALGDVVERLVPAAGDPASLAPTPGPLHRVQDPVGIGDLGDRGRALGAVAPARTGVLGIALELADLHRLLVHVRQQATRRLAVEARGRHQHVALLDLARPRLRVQLDPVVPALLGREHRQVHTARTGVERLAPCLGVGPRGGDPLVEFLDAHVRLLQASGTDWPACT